MATMNQSDKQALRTLTRGMYDYQKLRISTGNRLAGHFRAQLGQEAGMSLDELTPEAQQVLDTLHAEYKLLADGVASTPPSRWGKLLDQHTGLIASPYELSMARHYFDMKREEEAMLRDIAALVKQFAVWTHFLDGVRGCGPLMAAVIISELDPHRARHPSSFWSYCGLDVAVDGRGRSRRTEHLVDRPYTNKEGKEDVRKGITFNPFVKTKVVGVLGTSFLRSGGQYGDIYRAYKHRLESHPRYGLNAEAEKVEGATKLHRHNMAMRYAVKMFLLDLWKEWRALEGLPVGTSYAEGKLGIVHGQEEVA